jgi:SAM-dependent methyltransferase
VPVNRLVTGHAGAASGCPGGRLLPAVAAASVDSVAALYTLYHYADPRRPVAEARRVLRPGGLFVACAPNRDSDPELAEVVPDWGGRHRSTARMPLPSSATLHLPLPLTMRGCLVYATKAPGQIRAARDLRDTA